MLLWLHICRLLQFPLLVFKFLQNSSLIKLPILSTFLDVTLVFFDNDEKYSTKYIFILFHIIRLQLKIQVTRNLYVYVLWKVDPFGKSLHPLLIRNEYCVTYLRIFGTMYQYMVWCNKVWILGEIKTDIWLKNKADYLLRR